METISIHLRIFILFLIILVFTYLLCRISHLIDNYNRCEAKKLTWDCYKYQCGGFAIFWVILILYLLGESIYFFSQFLIWLFPELTI